MAAESARPVARKPRRCGDVESPRRGSLPHGLEGHERVGADSIPSATNNNARLSGRLHGTARPTRSYARMTTAATGDGRSRQRRRRRRRRGVVSRDRRDRGRRNGRILGTRDVRSLPARRLPRINEDRSGLVLRLIADDTTAETERPLSHMLVPSTPPRILLKISVPSLLLSFTLLLLTVLQF